jgi:hypothetical protein
MSDFFVEIIAASTIISVMSFPRQSQSTDWLVHGMSVYVRKFKVGPVKKRPSKPDASKRGPKSAGGDGSAYWMNYIVKSYLQSPDVIQNVFIGTFEKTTTPIRCVWIILGKMEKNFGMK